MRARCLSNDGRSLSENYKNLDGYTAESIFDVAIGKEYQVFAMSLWSGAILILLADENHLPSWFPIELFLIIDSRLPNNWAFASTPASSYLQGLWGYELIINDPSHYDGLLERNPEALRSFYEEEKLLLGK